MLKALYNHHRKTNRDQVINPNPANQSFNFTYLAIISFEAFLKFPF